MTIERVISENLKEIYLAGGCFWGIEHFMRQIKGVLETSVGYANGITQNPTYKDVTTGKTGYAETVYVSYDKTKVNLAFLLDLFYETIDPTNVNKQGNDIGPQYRTGIYYNDNADLEIITESINKLANNFDKEIAIEVLPLSSYYKAEKYHQEYLVKNPERYCHIPNVLFDKAANAIQYSNNSTNSSTLNAYKKMNKDELKITLSNEQYNVTQNGTTEAAYSNKYWDNYDKGIYVDVTSGEPLFISSNKYHSGCGWPSFSKPINKEVLTEYIDDSHGLKRIEVKSKLSDSHLGHVFDDGPKNLGGLRYCINSAALRFVSIDDMEDEGYGYLISILDV